MGHVKDCLLNHNEKRVKTKLNFHRFMIYVFDFTATSVLNPTAAIQVPMCRRPKM